MRRRLLALSMAACVLASGCGVRMGMEKVDDAKQAKKQAEDVQRELEKEVENGQEN